MFDANPPFTDDQLHIHQMVIKRRRELGSISRALDDELFLDDLWRLLDAWGMNTRSARLAEPEAFKEGICAQGDALVSLSEYELKTCPQAQFEHNFVPQVYQVIKSLDVNRNKSKLVRGF